MKEESVNEGPDCSAVRNKKRNEDENSNERWTCEGAARGENGWAIGGAKKVWSWVFGARDENATRDVPGYMLVGRLGPVGSRALLKIVRHGTHLAPNS